MQDSPGIASGTYELDVGIGDGKLAITNGRSGEVPGRALEAVGSALKDLAEMPLPIRRAFGRALRAAQNGAFPEDSRPFGEGLDRAILKLVEDYGGDTYRAAYVITFPECVYLLHVFKKKSSSGVATPRPEKATIAARWKAAKKYYEEHYGSNGGRR